MTKQQLIQLAGSQSELAKILGINRAAVCQWKAVPELRMRQLKDLRPQWFTQEKTWKKPFLPFGLPPVPQWSGHLALTAHTVLVVAWSLAPLAVMATLATQTVIDVRLFETRLDKDWSPCRKENPPLLPKFLLGWTFGAWECTFTNFILATTSRTHIIFRW